MDPRASKTPVCHVAAQGEKLTSGKMGLLVDNLWFVRKQKKFHLLKVNTIVIYTIVKFGLILFIKSSFLQYFFTFWNN